PLTSASSSSRECVPPSRFFSIRSTMRMRLASDRREIGYLIAGEGGLLHWLAATQIDARRTAAEAYQQLVRDDARGLSELVEADLVVALATQNDDLVADLHIGQARDIGHGHVQ